MKTLSAAELAAELELERVLAVVAHPDDVDFGSAGLIAGLTTAGVQVSYLVITNGDAGGFEPGQETGALAARRQAEQREAAARVGVTDVEYLGHPDGGVEPSHELTEQIVRAGRRVQPQLIIAQHPQRDWTRIQKSHPDHLAAGEAVTRAIYPALENPYAYPHLETEEGLKAFRLQYLLLMAAPEQFNNLRVDITDTLDAKLHALDAHVSQHPDPEWMHTMVRKQAESWHPEDGRAAELYHLVQVNGPRTFSGF